MSSLMRLHRYIASTGVASRRKAESLIAMGAVAINGKVVQELGVQIDPERDQVSVHGRLVRSADKGIMLLNKPRGVVTTLSEEEDRPTIRQYLTKKTSSYFPVGRLDYDTSGLLVLTNDGDVAQVLAHPRFQHIRRYQAKVRGIVNGDVSAFCESGIMLADGIGRAKVEPIEYLHDATWVSVEIYEGRNRIVRRIFAALNHPVLKLERLVHGPFALGDLCPGEMRRLTFNEYMGVRTSLLQNGGPAGITHKPWRLKVG